MKPNRSEPGTESANPYPQGFVYGQGTADPRAWSLAGLKIKRALAALKSGSGSILELGCGGGQYIRAFLRHLPGREVWAIDLDPQAVAVVQGIPGVHCETADAAALPFKDGQFGAVVGFDIFEHVARPERVFGECARVLKPQGLLHAYIPCEGNPGTVYMRKGHEYKARYGGHCQQYSTGQMMELLEQAGFSIKNVRHADYALTQFFDYMFFKRLAHSPDPQALWAAQALQSRGGIKDWVLRLARRILSALAWLEGNMRRSAKGAMGVHVTAVKKSS